MTMSTRGRPSCARGITSTSTTLPRASHTGLVPSRWKICDSSDALVAHRLVAPDDERDLLRILAVLLQVVGEHLLGELDAHLVRRRLRHLVRDRCRRSSCRSDRQSGLRIGSPPLPPAMNPPRSAAHQAVELARAGRDDAPLHFVGEHLGLVRQQASVDADDRVDRSCRAAASPARGRTCAARTGCSAPSAPAGGPATSWTTSSVRLSGFVEVETEILGDAERRSTCWRICSPTARRQLGVLVQAACRSR